MEAKECYALQNTKYVWGHKLMIYSHNMSAMYLMQCIEGDIWNSEFLLLWWMVNKYLRRANKKVPNVLCEKKKFKDYLLLF